jgi:hypothetical protein
MNILWAIFKPNKPPFKIGQIRENFIRKVHPWGIERGALIHIIDIKGKWFKFNYVFKVEGQFTKYDSIHIEKIRDYKWMYPIVVANSWDEFLISSVNWE